MGARRAVLVAANASYVHTNLAITQIAEYARAHGEEVLCYETHTGNPFMAVYRDIVRLRPDVVGFSCYIWNRDFLLALARAVKLATNALVVFGGPEAGMDAQAFLREEAVDHVVSGEGEAAFLDILRGGAPAHVQGEESGDWPEGYPEGFAGLPRRIVYAETSRGCPYRCAFCLSGAAGRMRAFPAEEALRRLRRFSEAGVALVKLVDRTFNFDRDRALLIWKGLLADAKSGAKTRWHFEIEPSLLDEETIAFLAEVPPGLFQFEIGVQSTDKEVLRRVRRAGNFSGFAPHIAALTGRTNIPMHLDLIAGLPGDTLETFAKSFNDLYALRPDRLQLGFLKLLHGSALRESAREDGIAYSPDAPYEVLFTRDMSAEDLLGLHDIEYALDWYYNDKVAIALLDDILGEDAFATYCALAGYIRKEGGFARSLSLPDRLGYIYSFARDRLPRGKAADRVLETLLSRSAKHPLPDFLRGEVRERRVNRALLPGRGRLFHIGGIGYTLYGGEGYAHLGADHGGYLRE